MICALSSRSSRGLTVFTEPCVPTGMNAGVSMLPCAVTSRPTRALVFLSCAFSSNIFLTLGHWLAALERQLFLQKNGEQFFCAAQRAICMAILLLDRARRGFCLGNVATFSAAARSNRRSGHVGLSLTGAAQTHRRRIRSHQWSELPLSRFSVSPPAFVWRFSRNHDRSEEHTSE